MKCEQCGQMFEDWRTTSPAYEGEPTGIELVDRLRGIYITPVNDGAGLLDGKDTFERRFAVGPIQLMAADEIVRLLEFVSSVREADRLCKLTDTAIRLRQVIAEFDREASCV